MKVWKCFIPKCIFIHPFWTDVLYVVACSCYYHCLVACKNKPTRFSHPPKNKEPLLSHYQLQQIFFLHFLYRFFFFLFTDVKFCEYYTYLRDAWCPPVSCETFSTLTLSTFRVTLSFVMAKALLCTVGSKPAFWTSLCAHCTLQWQGQGLYIILYIYFYDVWSNLNSNLPSILEGNHRCLCPCRFHHFGRGIVLDISGDMTSHS